MKGLIASHMHRRQAPLGVFPVNAPAVSLAEKPQGERDSRVSLEKASQPGRRVVTLPKSDLPAAWNAFSERREQFLRAREKPHQYTAVVQRAHAQMGVRATEGRMSILQPWLTIPDRSGRKTARRHLRWRMLSFFCIAAALLIATSFALSSNAFRIEQVNVVGTHSIALTDTIQRMGMQGQNIFLLDVEALTQRIDTSPLVASVRLDKQWPNQLTITVVERKPVLLWQTANGTYGIDNQGMVIAEASEMTGIDHLNTVIAIGNRQPGQRGKAAAQLHPGSHLKQADISFAMQVFTSLPRVIGISAFQLHYDATIYTGSAGSASSTISPAADGSGSFIIESPDGWIAYLGGASDANPLENRLIELQQILTIAQQQQLSLAKIDLRYGLYPVYTLKQ